MFSMSRAALSLVELSQRMRVLEDHRPHTSTALTLAWPELDAVLPDGGLPLGVTELSSERALGTNALALAAIRASHTRDPKAWCAWIEVGDALHAPGLVASGVDLSRLLVVRPLAKDTMRVSVRVAASGAFDVIVIDAFVLQGMYDIKGDRRSMAPEVFVRKLALMAEQHGARIVLLTDSTARKSMPWPVALRLEIDRTPSELLVHVAKERHGRLNLAKARVPLSSRPRAANN